MLVIELRPEGGFRGHGEGRWQVWSQNIFLQ